MSMNILTVVSNRTNLLLKRQIEEYGSNLVAQSSFYEEVVELVNYHKPDIIIIDVSMEPFNQENVLKELMLISTKSKFIAISDYFSEEQKLRLFRIGIDSFIKKPFQPADLWEKLDSVKLVLDQEKSNYKDYDELENYYKGLNNSIKSQIKNISRDNDRINLNSKEEEFIFEFDNSKPSYNNISDNKHYMGLPKYIDRKSMEFNNEDVYEETLSKKIINPLSKIKGVLNK